MCVCTGHRTHLALEAAAALAGALGEALVRHLLHQLLHRLLRHLRPKLCVAALLFRWWGGGVGVWKGWVCLSGVVYAPASQLSISPGRQGRIDRQASPGGRACRSSNTTTTPTQSSHRSITILLPCPHAPINGISAHTPKLLLYHSVRTDLLDDRLLLVRRQFLRHGHSRSLPVFLMDWMGGWGWNGSAISG